MAIDQGQSPRLGQRAPVEGTYVQIFDLDPATDDVLEPVEAPWPGQLIFRQDLGILQIYNGESGAWQAIAGGIQGQLTYVGSTEPTMTPPDTFNLGDQWFNTETKELSTWDGTGWVLTEISAHQIGGGTFHHDIDLQARLGTPYGPLGERVEMTEEGLFVYGAAATGVDGQLTTKLGVDGQSKFEGQAEINQLIVTEKGTFRKANEISRGGSLLLTSNVTAPGSAPTVSLDWEALALTGYDLANHSVLGMSWDAASSQWLIPVNKFTAPTAGRMLTYDASGSYTGQYGADQTYASAGGYLGGVRVGSTLWWLYSPGAGDYYLQGPGVLFPYNEYTPGSAATASLAYDGTNLIVAEGYTFSGAGHSRLMKYDLAATQGANVVPNPSFEVNTSGWSASLGTIARTITAPFFATGVAALQLTGSGTASNQYSIVKTPVGTSGFAVTGHKRYRASVQVRSGGPVAYSGSVYLWFYDSGGANIGGKTATISASPGGWQTYTINDAYAPASAVWASVEVWFLGIFGNKVYVDDVQVTSASGFNFNSATLLNWSSATIPPANALYIGNGDFGAKHYVQASAIAAGNLALVAPDSTKAEDTTKTWSLPAVVPRGIGYDGTAFWVCTNAALYKMEPGTNFSTATASWWAGYTWQDTTPPGGSFGPLPGQWHETSLSPLLNFTMKRRSRITITTAPINNLGSGTDEPTAVGVYLGRKTTAPVSTEMWSNGTSTTQVLLISTAAFAAPATHPPPPGDTTKSFPPGVPAQITSAVGGFEVLGDGTGDWPALRVTVQDENVDKVTGLKTLDFQGAGVSVAPGALGEAVVTITGSGSSSGGPMDTWEAICDTVTDLTTTSVIDITGCTVDVPVASTTDKFLVVGTADLGSTQNINMTGALRLNVAGTDKNPLIVYSTAVNGERATVHQNWLVTGLAAGTRTFKFMGANTAGTGTVRVRTGSTHFTVVKLEGPEGPQGPAGATPTLGYTHTQATASSVWTFTNPLSFVPGGLLCVDSAGDQIIGDVNISGTTITIVFSAASSGHAYLS
jgi:hypothetical protein